MTQQQISDTNPVTMPTDDPVLAERQRIVDAAVRYARLSGLCSEFERALSALMPEMADPTLGTWTDSDGVTCRGEEWRDEDGFNRAGLDRDGYDRDGFHPQTGRNRDGFDRNGLDDDGLTADDPARFKFDYAGRTVKSYTANRSFIYDRRGRDVEGWDAYGYNVDGRYDRNKSRDYVQGR